MANVTGGPTEPDWLNAGDNAWQLSAATFVGLQSLPGLVVLYAGKLCDGDWSSRTLFIPFQVSSRRNGPSIRPLWSSMLSPQSWCAGACGLTRCRLGHK
jgi:hypothetical protein